MIFFGVTQFQGDVTNQVFEEIRWEPRTTLPAYDFVAGDTEFVRRLAAGDLPGAEQVLDMSSQEGRMEVLCLPGEPRRAMERLVSAMARRGWLAARGR